ncbi:MAG TPA: response regulator [Acidimicrobiia bacterium]|jgi:AmiR/NasT family two-component response regulator|nr:response regulator [Acidimicrobiia bacterium]
MCPSQSTPIASPWFADKGKIAPTIAPRVLVEEDDVATRHAMVATLRAAGFDTVGCGGPDHQGERPCPLEVGEDCPAAVEADVIFFSFRLAEQRNRLILKKIRRVNQRTPIVVEIPEPQINRYQDVLNGTTLVHSPLTRQSLTKAVLDAWNGPDRLQRVLRESLPSN